MLQKITERAAFPSLSACVGSPSTAMSEKVPLLPQEATPASPAKFTLVIHGGAGTMDKSRSTPELRKQYKAALSRALLAGYTVLNAGGEAMDAAVAAVSSLEGTCHFSFRVYLLCTGRPRCSQTVHCSMRAKERSSTSRAR